MKHLSVGMLLAVGLCKASKWLSRFTAVQVDFNFILSLNVIAISQKFEASGCRSP
jgi:hypothetical protein